MLSGAEIRAKFEEFPEKLSQSPLLYSSLTIFALIVGYWIWRIIAGESEAADGPNSQSWIRRLLASVWELIANAAAWPREWIRSRLPTISERQLQIEWEFWRGVILLLFALAIGPCFLWRLPTRLSADEYLEKSYAYKYNGMMQEHRANYIEIKEQIANLTRLVEELVAKSRKGD